MSKEKLFLLVIVILVSFIGLQSFIMSLLYAVQLELALAALFGVDFFLAEMITLVALDEIFK